MARLLFLCKCQLLHLPLSYIPDNKTKWPQTAQTSGRLGSEAECPVCSWIFSKTDPAGITGGAGTLQGSCGGGGGDWQQPLSSWALVKAEQSGLPPGPQWATDHACVSGLSRAPTASQLPPSHQMGSFPELSDFLLPKLTGTLILEEGRPFVPQSILPLLLA